MIWLDNLSDCLIFHNHIEKLCSFWAILLARLIWEVVALWSVIIGSYFGPIPSFENMSKLKDISPVSENLTKWTNLHPKIGNNSHLTSSPLGPFGVSYLFVIVGIVWLCLCPWHNRIYRISCLTSRIINQGEVYSQVGYYLSQKLRFIKVPVGLWGRVTNWLISIGSYLFSHKHLTLLKFRFSIEDTC